MKISKKLIWTNVISLLIFIFILLGVKYTGLFTKPDLYVNSLFSLIVNNFLINLSKGISIIFDTTNMVVISLILSAYLWKKYSRKEAMFFSITMLLDAVILFILKILLKIPRPISNFLAESDFSFPSGHATTATVFFGLLIYLTLRRIKNIKWATIFIAVFMILLISLARLYLSIHWLSDIIGGFCLGIFILTICIIIKKYFENGRS